MKFVFPCQEYQQQAAEYIREFYEYGSEINGSGALNRYLRESTYERWLDKVRRDLDLANIAEDKVPACTYFYVREEDNQIVGMINIRLALNDFLRKEGGHIGYSIRPTERRKGYGTQMLRETLRFMKRMEFKQVLLSCDKDNPASAGVIRNCGGILEEEFYSSVFHSVIQRYHILLKETED